MSDNVYRVDAHVAATLYIVADSLAEAKEKAKEVEQTEITIAAAESADVTGDGFEQLPEREGYDGVTLSPVATLYAPKPCEPWELVHGEGHPDDDREPAEGETHSFVVTWTMDIEAATPEEAARKARHYQTKRGTTATVFTCEREGAEPQVVDLTEIDEATPEEPGADSIPKIGERVVSAICDTVIEARRWGEVGEAQTWRFRLRFHPDWMALDDFALYTPEIANAVAVGWSIEKRPEESFGAGKFGLRPPGALGFVGYRATAREALIAIGELQRKRIEEAKTDTEAAKAAGYTVHQDGQGLSASYYFLPPMPRSPSEVPSRSYPTRPEAWTAAAAHFRDALQA